MMKKRLQFVTIFLATTMAVMLVCWGASSHLTAQQMDPPPFPAAEGPAMPAAADQAPAAPKTAPRSSPGDRYTRRLPRRSTTVRSPDQRSPSSRRR